MEGSVCRWIVETGLFDLIVLIRIWFERFRLVSRSSITFHDVKNGRHKRAWFRTGGYSGMSNVSVNRSPAFLFQDYKFLDINLI